MGEVKNKKQEQVVISLMTETVFTEFGKITRSFNLFLPPNVNGNIIINNLY